MPLIHADESDSIPCAPVLIRLLPVFYRRTVHESPTQCRIRRAIATNGRRAQRIGAQLAVSATDRHTHRTATASVRRKEDSMDFGLTMLLGNVLMAIFLYIVVKIIWEE